MRLLMLLLVPATLVAGPSRYARLGEFQGQVEVQLTAADPWIPAERNLPLSESAWLRTGAGSLVEIELDDGSAWRLGPGSQAEISDYTRLSTGQRITVLSLDQGTAYFTGQPRGKDVMLLVVPGAETAVIEGSRVRQTAQPGWSQVAVLEGHVRFSSPAAELDIREGKTIRVEPGNTARFFLYPEVVAEPLDRWSEDRDKAEGAAASAAYVTAQYGLADLDASGKWLDTDDLGAVWKPDVEAGWAPYQKGRWRYLDSLGYTWVSDDSWGWLPYHNGRWTRKGSLGWVWQPAVSTVFHPGEVYWLRATNFAGWGPLAPGEQWNSPGAGALTPQGYTAGFSSYASLSPDARTLDGTGFAAPTAEQLKAAVFVPALPSPAFLTARLDATRPVLRVGRTHHVTPSVPGVTFGDAPPCDAPSDQMVNPPVEPPSTPQVADVSSTPPDGIYPVPVAMVPVIEVPVIVNAPAHPDYSRPAPGTSKSGSPSGPTGAPTSSSAGGSVPTTSKPPTAVRPTEPVHPPGTIHPTEPVHRPVTPTAPPKVDSSTPDPAKKFIAGTLGEPDYHRLVLKDIEPSAPNFNQALADLDAWTKNFPRSASVNDRLYYYVHVYNATGHADRVLEAAGSLVDAGVRTSFADEQQVLQILVAASTGLQKLSNPTAAQLATGQKAARELLAFLPSYFTPRRKPAKVSDSEWSLTRVQLEGVARDALARQGGKRAAGN